MSFLNLELHERLLKALDKLAFDEPTPVQAQVIPLARTHSDLVVSAKTGSGKTAAFILPMLQRFLSDEKPHSGTRGLILLPTRELALQTQKMFQALAGFTQIKAGLIIGGEPFKYQISTVRRNPEVLIATPGRLVEHINNNNVDFSELEYLVLDEADRMLDMGFSEELETISSACNVQRQNILLSATFKHRAFSRVRAQLKNPLHVEVDAQQGLHENIVQQRIMADDDSHKEKLAAALIEYENAERVFVFCNTRAQVQRVCGILGYKKIRTGFLHGEVAQSDRKQVLNRFRDGAVRVLVATDVAARGIDVNNVDLVINFNVPHSGDDYVHRVGRTGRADKKGLAVLLVRDIEWNKMSSIERYLKVRFESRSLPGLEAKYQGPKKLKNSGKAAGPKKKVTTKGRLAKLKKPLKTTKSGKTHHKTQVKKAPTQTASKNLGALKVKKSILSGSLGDGMSPPKRRPKND